MDNSVGCITFRTELSLFLKNKLGFNVEFPFGNFLPAVYAHVKFHISPLSGFDELELKSGARLVWMPSRWIELNAFCEYTHSYEDEDYTTAGINARLYV